MAYALYRFYNDTGRLLYVGITDNPHRRFGQHGKAKEWWASVRGISIDWYDTRAHVEAAELRAINIEQPAYNKVGRRPVSHLPSAAVAGEFTQHHFEFLDWFECIWTATWWDAPGRIDQTASPYRHDGRLYATLPAHWRQAVVDLVLSGTSMRDIAGAVFDAREGCTPETLWPAFFERASGMVGV